MDNGKWPDGWTWPFSLFALVYSGVPNGYGAQPNGKELGSLPLTHLSKQISIKGSIQNSVLNLEIVLRKVAFDSVWQITTVGSLIVDAKATFNGRAKANIKVEANGKAFSHAGSNSWTNAKANDLSEPCQITLLSPVVTNIFLLLNAPCIVKVMTPPRQQQGVLQTDMALSRRVSPENGTQSSSIAWTYSEVIRMWTVWPW